MLSQKVFIYNPSSSGSGIYTLELYFKNPTIAQYLKLGDYVQDSTGNKYSVTTPTTLPHVDGSSITVSFVTTDTIPVEDSDYTSTAFTPNQVDARPLVRTSGSISNPSLYYGPNYEYTITTGWDLTVEADDAQVGDSIVDSGGKEFIISFLDPTNRFLSPIRVTEVLKEAVSPQLGDASLYSSTKNIKLFQGTPVSDPSRTVVRNRDNFVIDAKIKELTDLISAGGSSSGDIVQSEYLNSTGSTLPALMAVSSSTTAGIEATDVTYEANVLAITGVTVNSISDSSSGNVAKSGTVKNISTSFSTQDSVFVSKTGELINVAPEIGSNSFVSGDFIIYIGHIAQNESNPSQKDLELHIQVLGQL